MTRYRPFLVLLVTFPAVAASGQAQDAAMSVPVAVEVPQPSAANLLDEAAQLERQGEYEAAAAKYAAVPAGVPDSQRAALQAATCQEKAGRLADAVAAYDTAIAKNPSAYWAELALFQKARTCKALGNVADARACIAHIKQRFPDSSSLAEAAVLEAQIDGRDTTSAVAFLAREKDASGLYKQAIQADRNNGRAQTLQALDNVITRYPDTPAALRCRDARAHILTRDKSREARTEAGTEFLRILALVGDKAPNSRIAETARIRLAALCHSFTNRQDALALYQGLVNSEDKAIASRAALQIAGLHFELLQREKVSAGSVADSRWDDLRAMCSLVSDSNDAKPIERVRAQVMSIESLSWQNRYADCLAAAEAFLARNNADEPKQDIATVRFFAGKAAQEIKQYDKALVHFRWIVDACKGQKDIWEGMDHLPRTYYSIWDILRRTNAPGAEVPQAADALFAACPDSGYAKLVRVVTEQETQGAKMTTTAEAQSQTDEKGN